MTEEEDLSDQFHINDTFGYLPEKEFDAITALAAKHCKTPVALLFLADEDRLFLISIYGMNSEKKRLSIPFFSEPNEKLKTSIVKDIREDPVLVKHPFIDSTKFLFCASIPLIASSGSFLGQLCVLDYKPSDLTIEQEEILELFSDKIVGLLEWRVRKELMDQKYGLLLESEKQTELEKVNYEALINTTSDDIWSIDTEYRLIAFNHAFQNKMEILTGKKIAKGEFSLFAEKIPQDMHLRFKTYFERALSGESFTDEYCRPVKQDSDMDIWIELNGSPIYQQGKITGAAFFARTITQRKKAELRTQQSEANYKMLFESSPVPIMLLNVDSLHILEANAAALFKYGYPKKDLLGKSIGMLLREDDVCQFVESIQNLRGIGTAAKLEAIVHRKKNGELIQGEMLVHELIFHGSNCFLTIINDQTEHLKSVSIKSQMANILENSLNEIYVFDTKELRFLYVNRGAILNMGYSLEELRQLTPYQIKPEFDESLFRQYLAPLLSDQKEKLVFVTNHERKDGSTYPVEVHLQKMRYEGQPAFVAIIIDISEAKASEAKLQELNQLLEKSNDELEQFASITAHDLLEPLRMISGFTSLLERKYAAVLDEKGLKYLRFASDGSVRMQQMIKDILEYSRATTNTKEAEAFNLKDVLENVVNDLQLLIQSRKASIQMPITDCILFADKNAIYRLFLNLVNNALKFVPEERIPKIEILLLEDEHHYKFTVSDNGIGIDQDHLYLLFKPYSRLNTRQKFDGTGLGLATCKKIVEHHGGSIWVTSQLNVGSQFHVKLPKKILLNSPEKT